MTDKEMRATLVAALPLDEASAKVRTGAPRDDDGDYDLPIWAGVIPLTTTPGQPITDPAMRVDAPIPGSVTDYHRP